MTKAEHFNDETACSLSKVPNDGSSGKIQAKNILILKDHIQVICIEKERYISVGVYNDEQGISSNYRLHYKNGKCMSYPYP